MGAALLLGGCWQDDLVDGTFTPEEWAFIETFRLEPPPPPCDPDDGRILDCPAAVSLGELLFRDPLFSDPPTGPNDMTPSVEVSCATCHQPPAYADTRPTSAGVVGTTARNTQSLVNIGYRDYHGRNDKFTWTGAYVAKDTNTCAITAGTSVELDDLVSVLVLPMCSASALATTRNRLADEIIFTQPARDVFEQAFGPLPLIMPDVVDPDAIYVRVALAFAAYERSLVTGPAPFDRYLGDGGDGLVGEPGALDPQAKRGLALFIGRGLCSECHVGPLFADTEFHNTGVSDRGTPDAGRGGTGRFRTPTLRNVAKTAPYMHNGQIETLAQVVDFYRWGGDDVGFVGDKDPMVQPLGLADDDIDDLVAFLCTLTSPELEDESACGP